MYLMTLSGILFLVLSSSSSSQPPSSSSPTTIAIITITTPYPALSRDGMNRGGMRKVPGSKSGNHQPNEGNEISQAAASTPLRRACGGQGMLGQKCVCYSASCRSPQQCSPREPKHEVITQRSLRKSEL